MENYLMLNGQKIGLTDSQYKEIMNVIGDSAPNKKNPFSREEGKTYYTICSGEEICIYTEHRTENDDLCYDSANYCSDKVLLTQRAAYEKVERNLWRFSMENGGSGKYFIFFNKDKDVWTWDFWSIAKFFGPSFVSKEVAVRAINEVLIPLLEKENIEAADLFEWEI